MPSPVFAFLRTAALHRILIGLAFGGTGLSACLPLSAQTYQIANIIDTATAAPDGTTFTNFYIATGNEPSLNNSGTVAFYAATGGLTRTGVFTGGTGGLHAIAREGDPYSGGSLGSFANLVVPRINDAGTVAFGNVGNTGYGLFTGGTGGIQVVARPGDPTPAGNNFTNIALYPAINNSGSVAFLGQSPIGGDPYAIGIYTSNGGSLNAIARVGDAALGGVFTNVFASPGINNTGEVVFSATLTGATTTSGYFVGDAAGIHVSAQRGQTLPGGGTIDSITAYPAINDNGTVVFYASTAGGPSSGIYTENGGVLNAVGLAGEAAPGGGAFDFFSINQGINASGDVAFEADVVGGALPGLGLFIHTNNGDQRLVGTGDALFGSTVTNFYFDNSGLNNAGQVAFSYLLANGVSGIAFAAPASVPEPGAIALLGASGFSMLGLATRRKRLSA